MITRKNFLASIGAFICAMFAPKDAFGTPEIEESRNRILPQGGSITVPPKAQRLPRGGDGTEKPRSHSPASDAKSNKYTPLPGQCAAFRVRGYSIEQVNPTDIKKGDCIIRIGTPSQCNSSMSVFITGSDWEPCPDPSGDGKNGQTIIEQFLLEIPSLQKKNH